MGYEVKIIEYSNLTDLQTTNVTITEQAGIGTATTEVIVVEGTNIGYASADEALRISQAAEQKSETAIQIANEAKEIADGAAVDVSRVVLNTGAQTMEGPLSVAGKISMSELDVISRSGFYGQRILNEDGIGYIQAGKIDLDTTEQKLMLSGWSRTPLNYLSFSLANGTSPQVSWGTNSYDILHRGNMPTPDDIAALPIDGNAVSASKLETARLIAGKPFDGTKDIEITADDVNALPIDGNAVSASKLETPRLISGVQFDGSSDITITAGDVNALPADGVAESAKKLETARLIAGKPFDGIQDIELTAGDVNALPLSDVVTATNYNDIVGKVSRVSSEGVLNLCNSIDFHVANSTNEYDARLQVQNGELLIITSTVNSEASLDVGNVRVKNAQSSDANALTRRDWVEEQLSKKMDVDSGGGSGQFTYDSFLATTNGDIAGYNQNIPAGRVVPVRVMGISQNNTPQISIRVTPGTRSFVIRDEVDQSTVEFTGGKIQMSGSQSTVPGAAVRYDYVNSNFLGVNGGTVTGRLNIGNSGGLRLGSNSDMSNTTWELSATSLGAFRLNKYTNNSYNNTAIEVNSSGGTILGGTLDTSGNISTSGSVLSRSGLIRAFSSGVPMIEASNTSYGIIMAIGASGLARFSSGSNGSEGMTRMSLDTSGNMAVTGRVTATNIASTSDIRLKSDLKPILNCLDKVSKIKPYNFMKFGISGRENGLIAQDVELVLPDSVRDIIIQKNGSDLAVKTVDYSAISSLNSGAINELHELVKQLQEEIRILKSK
ncbi:tail fiber domain-containing protein [Aeromonas hydrophila]|uniref:tail fiber domain-containing protein n=1 Tax=Aeromonas hydrophila TaxID=644 RepID=UPI003EC7FA50